MLSGGHQPDLEVVMVLLQQPQLQLLEGVTHHNVLNGSNDGVKLTAAAPVTVLSNDLFLHIWLDGGHRGAHTRIC